jgi:hypothetical protein
MYFRKSCRLWDNVEKYDSVRQVRGENLIRRVRAAYWITKATNTHAEYVIFIFHGNSAFADAPEFHVYRFSASLLKFCVEVRHDHNYKLCLDQFINSWKTSQMTAS